MVRRKKDSPAEDLIAITAMAPWWVGVILAAVSYVWLSHIAATPVSAAVEPGRVAASLAPMLGHFMAQFGQYLLPGIFLLGAGLSAWKRKQRARLLEDSANNAQGGMLDGVSWQEFELLVGEVFRRQGYAVTEQGGSQPDGGVDLVLQRGNEKFLVQCKQWRALKVGVTIVRELYGVMAARGAVGGYVITSGQFTKDAQSFAEGRNVELVDGLQLKKWIAEVKKAPAPAALAKAMSAQQAIAAAEAKVLCPKCDSLMIKRTAKSGSNAGNDFWGCSQFPQCRGVRELS